MKTIQHQLTIPDDLAGMRLDQALVKLLPDYSRTQIQEWIKHSNLLLNEQSTKAKTVIFGGETISIEATPKELPDWQIAENIALDIIFEDEFLLVINKPAGMVVHPAAGNFSSTLLNALLHHCPELKTLPRAGIIHRLDKDTTGLLVIAKNPLAFKSLTHQLKARSISRIYQAIVEGLLVSGKTIDAPIERHPIQRKKMTVSETGKPAITHYRLIEKYRAHTRIKVELETGRTHQIRVHMAYTHHPLLGDPVYGGRLHLPKKATDALIKELRAFKRQALHAQELSFIHPHTQKKLKLEAPLPKDMQHLIQVLKKDAESIE